MSCIVATHQFQPERDDTRRNLIKMRGLVRESSLSGANIIVFPELCISGLVDDSESALHCAQTLLGYQTQMMSEMSIEMNCYIAFGFVELLDGLLRNSYAITSPSGHTYAIRKKNLTGSDNMWASCDESEVNEIILTPWGRVGCLIGADISNVNSLGKNIYQKGSVDLLLHPTDLVGEYSYPSSDWVGATKSICCSTIVSNVYGNNDSCSYKGGICIITKTKIHSNTSAFNRDCNIIAVL